MPNCDHVVDFKLFVMKIHHQNNNNLKKMVAYQPQMQIHVNM